MTCCVRLATLCRMLPHLTAGLVLALAATATAGDDPEAPLPPEPPALDGEAELIPPSPAAEVPQTKPQASPEQKQVSAPRPSEPQALPEPPDPETLGLPPLPERSRQQAVAAPQKPACDCKREPRPPSRPPQTVRPAALQQEPNQMPPTEERRIKCPDLDELLESLRPIDRLGTNILPSEGDLPPDCAQEVLKELDQPVVPLDLSRDWNYSQFSWVAPGLGHRPLYFEDAPLERYGQTIHPTLQPVFSAARFFFSVSALPYKMTLDPPNKFQYTLGYYRPGSHAPYLRQRLPWDTRAALVEAGVIAGLILLIP